MGFFRNTPDYWLTLCIVLLFVAYFIEFLNIFHRRRNRIAGIITLFFLLIYSIFEQENLLSAISSWIGFSALVLILFFIDSFLRKTDFGDRYGNYIMMWFIPCTVNIGLMIGQWCFGIFDAVTMKHIVFCLCFTIYCEIIGFMFYSLVINSRLQQKETLSKKVLYILKLIASIIIILTNLTEAVRVYDRNAFIGISSYFDSLYFVIVSFTTVGYGDVQPSDAVGKSIAILISVTSVLTLVLFVTSYMYNILVNKSLEDGGQGQ